MSDNFGGARVEELKFLLRLEREGFVRLTFSQKDPMRDMIAQLILERFVNYLGAAASAPAQFTHRTSGVTGESELERQLEQDRTDDLTKLLRAQEVRIELNHRGRVRLSELRQALKSGRVRERHGILWDGQHLDRDLELALAEASETSPVALLFLDMNGLKAINDSLNHDAGDRAIRIYFNAVATGLSDQGDAYCVGGDEVVVVLPRSDKERAKDVSLRICKVLARAQPKDFQAFSVSLGLGVTTDPKTDAISFKRRADEAMSRVAKPRAHAEGNRCSAIAVVGDDMAELVGQ